MVGPLLGALLAGHALGQEMVFFGTEDPGESKGLDLWGADTAWLSEDNVRRSVIYMGKPQTDVIRFSFTGDWALDSGDLSPDAQAEFDARMAIVNNYTNPGTGLCLNNDTDDWVTNPYLVAPYTDGVDPDKWAELIAVTAQKAVTAGHPVVSVSVFNEPDHATWQGDVGRFGDVIYRLRNNPAFPAFNYGAPDLIRMMGANTLNNQVARSWGYDQLETWDFVQEGNTHQLAGDMPSYIDFYETVQANGDVGTNDELHNVMEAMVGAEYGMDVGIWWGAAERTRGEFVKASDGDRLAYAENRPNWTAASVYRAPDGKIQAFVGESERQALPTNYSFVSKDRPVFFDGHGPQRVFDVTTTGGPGYQTADHHNAERVVNITWGEDVQPAIDGRYIIVARHSRKVMDVNGGPTATGDGANIDQWTYNGGLNQQWDVTPIPSTAGGDYSYFSIAAAHSGKFPDVVNYSYADGGDVRQYGTPGSVPGVNQQWFLEYAGDGWFYIRNRWSGKYLDVSGGVGATGDGANIHQWEGLGAQNQQWRFMPVDADPTDDTAPSAPSWVAASANAASVQLNWAASPEGDLDGYTVMRSTTPGGPYEIIARGLTDNAFTDPAANQNIPYYYVVRATDRSLNRSANSLEASATPSGDPALVAHYDFECASNDRSNNGNHGVVNDAADYVWGGVGGGTSLDLDGGYVSMPAEVVNHDQVTIATWVYWNGGDNWQRIFDFGNGTDEYLFLTPANYDGQTMQFTIFQNGAGQSLYAPALSVGEWTHVAVTLANGTGRLYVNGTESASWNGFTFKPSDFNPVINSIGKSQYPDDPLFSGAIDDFRIYNHALTAAEVAGLANVPVTDPIEDEVVSWNLNDWSDSPTGASPTAGVVDVPYWNDSYLDGGNVTDLRDNSGASTTLDIVPFSSSGTWRQLGYYHVGPDADGTLNREILKGYLNGTGPAGAGITLNQIPYPDYDLYVYFAADDTSRSGTVTDGTTTYSFNVLDGQVTGANALLAQTTDTGSGYPEANYAVFSGLSGPSQTVSTDFGGTYGGICAIQIVRTTHVVDTAPPVITVSGDNPMTLECGIGAYVEAGATVRDECDPSVAVVIGGDTIDPDTPGTYLVTYDATDESGNVAAQATRTVHVVDTTPPVIALNGSASVTLECGIDGYTEPGASASDACDPAVSVVIGGDPVNPSAPGIYVVTYNATDTSGNPAVQVTRTVTVVDTTPPVLALNGNASVTLECGIDGYTEAGATASDACDPSVSVVIGGDTVDPNVRGSYLVTYDATDASGNPAVQLIRTVTVVDTTPPVITLNGSASVTLECGIDSYTEPGATASDACDPSVSVVVGGQTVDPTTFGTYVVTYDATDASGNVAVRVTRTVHVVDGTPPVITLNGDASVTLECGIDSYTELGASASDACDPAVAVLIGGDTVDATTLGSYVVTYDASDASGNAADRVTRTVTVVDTTPPVITLNGSASILLCAGDEYVEQGAAAADICAGDLTADIAITGSVNTAASGTYEIHYNVSDPSGNAAVEQVRTIVVDEPPVASHGGPYVVNEGGVVTLTASATDADDPIGTLSYAWDLDNNGSFETTGTEVDFDASLLDGNSLSTYTVALEVTDERGCSASTSTTVEVLNVAPTVESVVAVGATLNPIPLGGTATIEVTFSDPCALDTHEVAFHWGNGTTTTVVPGANPYVVSGSYSYPAPGVYRVDVDVIDDDGGVGSGFYQYVVVYDPSGGFVTGGGTIQSPAGAYTPDPALTGQANFGFVSKYKKGANAPTGQTQFNFNVADLNFHSTTLEWLVVSGQHKAIYKGSGTINGAGDYGFILSAIDGDNLGSGGNPDRFRIKIWDAVTAVVVYDNDLGTDENADAVTVISGGSIVVHTGGKGK